MRLSPPGAPHGSNHGATSSFLGSIDQVCALLRRYAHLQPPSLTQPLPRPSAHFPHRVILDPRGFLLGRFSNAGRGRISMQPLRRDPHQKTFTLAAGRPRSMLLRRVLQSRRSASAATPSKWPFKQRAAGCRVFVLSGSEAGCVRCGTAPETNPRGGRRCAAQRTLWSWACEGRRAASWHTSLSMRKSAMATFRERHCYRPKIAWQRVYD